MSYKVLFLDIDGTILMPDLTYSDSTKDAILQLKNAGIEVFIATGRPLHEIKELAGELHVDSFIGYNGAMAVYKNETILSEPLTRKQIEEFLEIAQKHDHEAVLYTTERNYFTNLDLPIVQEFNEYFGLRLNERLNDEVLDQILSLTVLNVPPSEAKLYKTDENIRLAQVHGGGITHAYDILRYDVNKGEAVKKVLNRLNLSKDQAIAFGDGMNDKEMLQSVGESFAMGNSDPDLFPYAKHRTTSVTESGIYNGLKTLGLVE